MQPTFSDSPCLCVLVCLLPSVIRYRQSIKPPPPPPPTHGIRFSSTAVCTVRFLLNPLVFASNARAPAVALSVRLAHLNKPSSLSPSTTAAAAAFAAACCVRTCAWGSSLKASPPFHCCDARLAPRVRHDLRPKDAQSRPAPDTTTGTAKRRINMSTSQESLAHVHHFCLVIQQFFIACDIAV